MKKNDNLKLVLVYGEDEATIELPLGGGDGSLYRVDYSKTCNGLPAAHDVAWLLGEHILYKLTGQKHSEGTGALFEACGRLAESIRDRKAKL